MVTTYKDKNIEDLNQPELLEAIADLSTRLYNGTKEPPGIKISRPLPGDVKAGIDNDLDENDSIVLGLSAVEIAEGRAPDKFLSPLGEND